MKVVISSVACGGAAGELSGMRLSVTHLARATTLAAASLAVLAAACGRSVATPAPLPPAPVRTTPNFVSGEGVATAMHDRYAGKWYSSLTFRQKTSRLLASGKWDVQTWYESMKVPGRLRIDFDP